MGVKADPKNTKLIADTEALIAQGWGRGEAMRATGINASTFRSHEERKRLRQEDERMWAAVGKSSPSKPKHRVDKKSRPLKARALSKTERDR